jgi:soluble lytic murein transglycosylase-like protein
LSIVRAESNFDPRALSTADAQGLMQLIPATAERFGVSDLQDPAQNIEAGLAYLRWLLKRFDHDVIKTTAAYNAGEGAVDRYKGVPPYPETRAYVERILSFYRSATHRAPPKPKSKRVRLSKAPARG